METHRDDVPERAFNGLRLLGAPGCADPEGRGNGHGACRRQALSGGRLLSPSEALALGGKTARGGETLFSIARAVAWETGAEQDEILCRLGEKSPVFA